MDLINIAMLLSAVLLIGSFSGLVSEKVGIVNIAINGMMIIGALSFKIFANIFQGQDNTWTWLMAILFAGLITAIFALMHGFATIILKADHVVSGTAINLLAAGIGLYLTFVIAPKFDQNNNTSNFFPIYSNELVGNSKYIMRFNLYFFLIGLLISVNIFIYFKYTKFGLRHAAIGENPNAADSAAVHVIRYKWCAVAFSGFLAGLAGAMMTFKMAGYFNGNVQGIGFLALAIMILGQWRISLIFIASVVFAFFSAIADKYVFTYLPKDFMKTIPFILSIFALIFLSRFQSAPKAVGKHFNKAKR